MKSHLVEMPLQIPIIIIIMVIIIGLVIGSFKTKANCQRTEVIAPLSRRSWEGTRDKPKNYL